MQALDCVRLAYCGLLPVACGPQSPDSYPQGCFYLYVAYSKAVRLIIISHCAPKATWFWVLSKTIAQHNLWPFLAGIEGKVRRMISVSVSMS